MKREKWLHILRGLPLLLCVVLIGWYFLSGQTLDVATLREMIQTDHLFLTMLLCCALFAVKSLTIFFPITVWYILNGCLFSPLLAIGVSFLGTAVCFSVPYGMGRFSGGKSVEHIMEKYPKVASLLERQRNHHGFVSFFLRVIHCLPGDLVSMYLGAIKTPYGKFLLGSLLGAAPAVIAETWIGTSVQEQNWEMLAWSIGASLGVAIISTVCYTIYQKKTGNKHASATCVKKDAS